MVSSRFIVPANARIFGVFHCAKQNASKTKAMQTLPDFSHVPRKKKFSFLQDAQFYS